MTHQFSNDVQTSAYFPRFTCAIGFQKSLTTSISLPSATYIALIILPVTNRCQKFVVEKTERKRQEHVDSGLFFREYKWTGVETLELVERSVEINQNGTKYSRHYTRYYGGTSEVSVSSTVTLAKLRRVQPLSQGHMLQGEGEQRHAQCLQHTKNLLRLQARVGCRNEATRNHNTELPPKANSYLASLETDSRNTNIHCCGTRARE